MPNKEEVKQICQLLRWLIKEEAGLSLIEVDRRLGRSENTVSRWLRGGLSRLEQVFAILRVVGMSPREFYLRLALRVPGPPLDPRLLGLVGMLKEVGGHWTEGNRPVGVTAAPEGTGEGDEGEGSR